MGVTRKSLRSALVGLRNARPLGEKSGVRFDLDGYNEIRAARVIVASLT